MRITTTIASLLLLFALVLAPATRAQTIIDVGPRVGIDVGGDIEEVFLGVDARATTSLPVVLNGVFDYYLTDDNVTFWQFSANALYPFPLDDSNILPYAGAGVGISRFSVDIDTPFGSFDPSSSDVGLNLIGGASFQAGSLQPFAQVQLSISDASLFTLGGGLLFTVSGGD